MSYQTLYRKYRPKSLKEVYGQNIITKILSNAIALNKISHAYLFTGPRGCGKTSVAKIIARMVNCSNLQDGAPCNKCKNCIESIQENCIDIIEIDAASNNGVDEIRELKNNVTVLPSSLKYKVYIIDEVHMLSTGAFNALLKTLEEPPEHIIFILATTDLEKVPITIISRCQTLEFKKINKNDMFDRLKEISNKEKIQISDDAIYEIVDQSDGGMRDAIGMLDLASSYTTDIISIDDITTINGNISIHEVEELTNLIINKKINESINKIIEYKNGGKDLIKLTEKILKQINILITKNNNTNICTIYEMLLNCLSNMKKSNLDFDYLMLSLHKIELLDNKNEEKIIEPNYTKIEDNNSNIRSFINNKIENDDTKNVIDKKEEKIIKIVNIKDTRVNNTFVDADKSVLKKIKEKWNELENYTLDRKYGSYVCELIDLKPVVASSKYLVLTHKYDSFIDKGNSNINKYEEVINKFLNIPIKMVFITENEWTKYKNEYIDNNSKGIKYQIIEEKIEEYENNQENNKDSDIIEKASELFDNIEIEIEE